MRLSEINLGSEGESLQLSFVWNLVSQEWMKLNVNSPMHLKGETGPKLAIINEESLGNSSSSFMNNVSSPLDILREKEQKQFHNIYRGH